MVHFATDLLEWSWTVLKSHERHILQRRLVQLQNSMQEETIAQEDVPHVIEKVRCPKATDLGKFADHAEFQIAQASMKSATVIVPIRAKKAGHRIESLRIEFPKTVVSWISTDKPAAAPSSGSITNANAGTNKNNAFAFLRPVKEELPDGFFEALRRFEYSLIEEFLRVKGTLDPAYAYKKNCSVDVIVGNMVSIEAQSSDAKYPDSSLRAKFNIQRDEASGETILLVATRAKVDGQYKTSATFKDLKVGSCIRTVMSPSYLWFGASGNIGITWYVTEMKVYDERATTVMTLFEDDDQDPVPPSISPSPAIHTASSEQSLPTSTLTSTVPPPPLLCKREASYELSSPAKRQKIGNGTSK